MGWYINYCHFFFYITAQIGAIYGHAVDMRTQRQHSRNFGYGGVTNGTLRSNQSATTTAAIELQAAAAINSGLYCCWAAGS